MKNKINQLIVIAFAAIIAISCGNSSEKNQEDLTPKGFTVKAELDTLPYNKAYLVSYKDGEEVRLDSSEIDSGSFSFSGIIDFPKVHYIVFNEGRNRITLFLENSDISVTGKNLNSENISIEGSSVHDELEVFNKELSVYNANLKQIVQDYYAAQEVGDEKLMEELDAKHSNEDSLKVLFVENYIQKNSNSVLGTYLLVSNMYKYELEELEDIYTNFSDSMKNTEYGGLIEKRVSILTKSSIGQEAPLFTLNDPEGNPISLESYRGNYLLVDFWASWCGPCRRENPNVVAAYKKYHDKGFNILGVSFDANKDKWLGAIEKDQLEWSHVSDLKGWKNAAGKIYGVNSIPHSVLIDENGVIVAKNLREEALHEKLAEIYAADS